MTQVNRDIEDYDTLATNFSMVQIFTGRIRGPLVCNSALMVVKETRLTPTQQYLITWHLSGMFLILQEVGVEIEVSNLRTPTLHEA